MLVAYGFWETEGRTYCGFVGEGRVCYSYTTLLVILDIDWGRNWWWWHRRGLD